MEEFFKNIDPIVRWITPFLTIIIGLVIFIYKSKVKELDQRIEKEVKDRKDDIKNVIELLKNFEEERKKSDKELIKNFSEEAKDEREWRASMVEKQQKQVNDIYDKLEDMNICINRVIEKIENYMISQEKICNERHKWNGVNRRSP